MHCQGKCLFSANDAGVFADFFVGLHNEVSAKHFEDLPQRLDGEIAAAAKTRLSWRGS